MIAKPSIIAAILLLIVCLSLVATSCGVDISDEPSTMLWPLGEGETADEALARWHKEFPDCYLVDDEEKVVATSQGIRLFIRYRWDD